MADAASKSLVDEFVERARAVTVDEAAERLALPRKRKGHEHAGPCPHCGGRDGFAFNSQKQKWNCRAAGIGGHDGISLAAHALNFDLRQRDGFLLTCAFVLDEDVPENAVEEGDDEKKAREERIVAKKAESAAKAASRDKSANEFRTKEIAKARGKWLNAARLGGTVAADYLFARTGYRPQSGGLLRFDPALDYWIDGNDGLQSIHCGPAMIAPFVNAQGEIIGCHQTWIDLSSPPKYRPDFGVDEKGNKRNSKKMRGSKMGGFIPVCGYVFDGGLIRPGDAGLVAKTRMVAGEGIETVLAVAFAERFRPDTLYCASGDLGNLAGKADHASDFNHPTLTKTDRAGRVRPLKIAGPVPDMDSPAMPVPDTITTLVLLADGDSERVWTAAQMARAKNRNKFICPALKRQAAGGDTDGRLVAVVWPGIAGDFADLVNGLALKSASGEQ